MPDPSDTKEFSRARLCQLGKVERSKHRRWIADGLLRKKRRYAPSDVMRAALLDEINDALKARAARAVWLAIRDEIGIPGKRLELVITLSTLKAQLVRSDSELVARLPRGDEVKIIDLSARAQAVDARVREHLVALPDEEDVDSGHSAHRLPDGGTATEDG